MSNITSNFSTSSDAFIQKVIDFNYAFIIPIICFFGICTNIINILVFSNKEMTDITYKYLKANAVMNIIYLAICFFLFMGRCGTYCDMETSMVGAVYIYFFYNYLKGIPAINTIIIQIIVSVLRLMIVANKKVSLPNFNLTILVMTVFSAIFYSPYIFTTEIVKIQANNNTTYNKYNVKSSSIGLSYLGIWLIIITTIIRGFISLAAILVIDILSAIKLKEHLEKKKKIKGAPKSRVQPTQNAETSFVKDEESIEITEKKREKKIKEAEEKASRNITYMVISIGILFFIGNAPNSIGFCLLQVQSIKTSMFIKVYAVLANIMLFTSQGLDIFIYYKFNKKYKSIIKKFLSSKK